MKNDIKANHILNIRGFTLIEVLIAITVLAFLMANIYTMVENSTRMKEDVTLEDRETLMVEAALERFAIDFSQIYSPLYNSVKAKIATQDQEASEEKSTEAIPYSPSERYPSISVNNHIIPTIESADKSELIFMTSSNRRVLENSKQSRYSWVRYSIRSSKDEPRSKEASLELVRAVSTTNPYAKEFDWDKVKEYVLLKNIQKFNFEFWNPDRKKFVEDLKMMDDHKWSPRFVKIKILWLDKSQAKISSERSFRILAPFFDTIQDEKDKLKSDDKTDSTTKDGDTGEDK